MGDIAADQLYKADIPLPPPSKPPTEVLNIDKATPDDHVPRDPRLHRLTGAHPLNCEAPLTTLFKEGIYHVRSNAKSVLIRLTLGFLTTPEMFYVRTHGPVPRVRDEDVLTWEISIEGSVSPI